MVMSGYNMAVGLVMSRKSLPVQGVYMVMSGCRRAV